MHGHFWLFKFVIWVLASSESLSYFHHELYAWLEVVPNSQMMMKHPQLPASNPKKWSNVLLATISSKEIEAAKKPIVVKENTQKSTVWAVRAFTSWAEESNKRSNLKCFALAIQLSYVIGFVCLWKRPSMMTDSHIHHVVSLNYTSWHAALHWFINIYHSWVSIHTTWGGIMCWFRSGICHILYLPVLLCDDVIIMVYISVHQPLCMFMLVAMVQHIDVT